jgi:hypothetical protein
MSTTTPSQTPVPAGSSSSNPDTLKQRSSTEAKNRTGKGAVNLSKEASDKLQSRVKGEIVLPSHPSYDQARAIWNAMIERRPLRLHWRLWTSQEFFAPKKTLQNLNVPSFFLAHKHTN